MEDANWLTELFTMPIAAQRACLNEAKGRFNKAAATLRDDVDYVTRRFLSAEEIASEQVMTRLVEPRDALAYAHALRGIAARLAGKPDFKLMIPITRSH